MKVSEEIDALRTLGFCTYRYLVVPRVIALVVVVPILALFGDVVGIGAGMLTVVSTLEITSSAYLNSTWNALDVWDVFGGVLKAGVFGFLIAMIACERGLATRRGAEGVGLSTTSAVVVSLFHLVLADVLFTILFQRFGL
jgi:phospholipid/cholesterol/gamma-HCH transport system permease protein